MYTESAGSRKTLGDVDVIFHDGIYHLFHLVLPNHDFIAHAVSDNCLTWRRVENALFLGHPGSWDDSMLWTIHVSPDPHRPGQWRMFYTGLSRRDHGRKQRIGMARSGDLYTWTKAAVSWTDRRSELPYALAGRPAQPPFEHDANSCFPLNPDAVFYESEVDEGRHWVSWRDPFYYHEDGQGWLLTAGRVKDGPVVRRGCVAVMQETGPDQFEPRRPLHHPGLYDDVEVPNLFKIDQEYYLVGSMREDAKIRYWHTDRIGNPWRSYADNVLLATGNYAGRVCRDQRGYLLWSFFTPAGRDRLSENLMPPPKRLSRNAKGQLVVTSFEGLDDLVRETVSIDRVDAIKAERATSRSASSRDGSIDVRCDCGFQIFAIFGGDGEDKRNFDDFRFAGTLRMLNEGKCGFVFRTDRQTHDGYYLSLDLLKGVAQIRAWGSGPEGSGEEMMQFRPLQAGYWGQETRGMAEFSLLVHGSYIELSIGGQVILSLADQEFASGTLGVYVESASLRLSEISLERLAPPSQSDEHLANG